MVPYEPKNWWHLCFSLRGTVISGVVIRAVMVALLTVAFTCMYKFNVFLPPKPKPHDAPTAGQPETPEPESYFVITYFPEVPTLVHTVIGFVLGLLIVFRTNSSYDRYWEGRKLWGTILNNSRNLARTAAVHVGPATDLARLLSVYALTLKHHLRGEKDLKDVKPLLSEADFARVSAAPCPPLVISTSLSRWIHAKMVEGNLNPQLIRLLEGYLGGIVEAQGGCERILKTPIPFIYAVHIKHLLFIYLFTLPLALIPSMGWWAAPAAVIIAFGLLGIEEAGLEIEDPFGTDPNDLPVDAICETVSRDVNTLTGVAKKG